MKNACKKTALVLTLMLLLLLCLTQAAFATDGLSLPLPESSALAQSVSSVQKTAVGSGETLLAADNNGSASPPAHEAEWKEVSSYQELWTLLYDYDMQSTGGNIKATADLTLPSDKRLNLLFGSSPLVLDMGEYTFYVDGLLNLTRKNTAITGHGGEKGLVHINKFGEAHIENTLFTVTQTGGYAIWQEQGGMLDYTANDNSSGEIYKAPLPVASASGFEELISLLDNEKMTHTGGIINITDNIVLPKDKEYHLTPETQNAADLTVNLGEYTFYIEGKLFISSNDYQKPGITFTGHGGENGLLNVKQNGEAYVSNAVFNATAEGGYALKQAEGSILNFEPQTQAIGKISFAEKAVALPYSYISPLVCLPVAVVPDGAELIEALPKNDEVQLFWQGVRDTDGVIPVTWDLEKYVNQLAAKERVVITGHYEDAAAMQEPTCLVVFEGSNPAVFLDCYGAEAAGRFSAQIRLKLLNPELSFSFEWSQNGEEWFPANSIKYSMDNGVFTGALSFSDKQPSYPYYISAVVNYPDESVGYSDIVVIRKTNMQGDNGGNRGGGTNITDPPTLPKPDSDPDDGDNVMPPVNSGSDNSGDSSSTPPPVNSGADNSGGSSSTPPPVNSGADNSGDSSSTPPPVNSGADNSGGSSSTPPPVNSGADNSGGSSSTPPPVNSGSDKTNEITKKPVKPTDTTSNGTKTISDSKSEPINQKDTSGTEKINEQNSKSESRAQPFSQENEEAIKQDINAEPKNNWVFHLVAGCAAVAGIICAAGLIINPLARKRLTELIQKIFHKKQQ